MSNWHDWLGEAGAQIPEAEWSTLNQYLRVLADCVGLKDWDVELDHHFHKNPADFAHTYVQTYGNMMRVRIEAEYRQWPEGKFKAIFVHELLHGPFQKLSDLGADTVKDALGGQAWAMLTDTYHQAEEVTIDTLAYALARWMPDPPELPE